MYAGGAGHLAHVIAVQVAVLVCHREVERLHRVPGHCIAARLHDELPHRRRGAEVVQGKGAVSARRGKHVGLGLRRVRVSWLGFSQYGGEGLQGKEVSSHPPITADTSSSACSGTEQNRVEEQDTVTSLRVCLCGSTVVEVVGLSVPGGSHETEICTAKGQRK